MTSAANKNWWLSPATRPLMPTEDLPCLRSVKPVEDILQQLFMIKMNGLLCMYVWLAVWTGHIYPQYQSFSGNIPANFPAGGSSEFPNEKFQK